MNAVTPFTVDDSTPSRDAANTQPAWRGERHDGWTPDRQATFLGAVADGCSVGEACRQAGLSAASAYAFRRRASGQAFALGWRAAQLVARDKVSDLLMARALDGQHDVVTRDDGSTISRHRYDNRLAMSLLTRLDRLAEAATDADANAARMVAQEFDAFLGLIEQDAGPAQAGLFLARRTDTAGEDGALAGRDLAPVLALASAERYARVGAATAGEVDIADLAIADRHGWTAEQWLRADAAGLIAIAPESQLPQLVDDEEDEDDAADGPSFGTESDLLEGFEPDPRIWFDDGEWMTDYPPPIPFHGEQYGTYDKDEDYARELSDDEAHAYRLRMDEFYAAKFETQRAAFDERDAFFADRAREADAAEAEMIGGSGDADVSAT